MNNAFDALNNFYDKIFVITLQRSANRQAHINTVLHGLNYEFFLGTDKKDLSLQEVKDKNIYNEALAVKHHRYSKPMNPGQIGCALSHKNIYEEIINKGYKKTLILEDDVEPVDESLIFFSGFVSGAAFYGICNLLMLYFSFFIRAINGRARINNIFGYPIFKEVF